MWKEGSAYSTRKRKGKQEAIVGDSFSSNIRRQELLRSTQGAKSSLGMNEEEGCGKKPKESSKRERE